MQFNKRLNAVLGRLGKADLKLNARKCQLLKEETVVLEHVVSRKEFQPIPRRSERYENGPALVI